MIRAGRVLTGTSVVTSGRTALVGAVLMIGMVGAAAVGPGCVIRRASVRGMPDRRTINSAAAAWLVGDRVTLGAALPGSTLPAPGETFHRVCTPAENQRSTALAPTPLHRRFTTSEASTASAAEIGVRDRRTINSAAALLVRG